MNTEHPKVTALIPYDPHIIDRSSVSERIAPILPSPNYVPRLPEYETQVRVIPTERPYISDFFCALILGLAAFGTVAALVFREIAPIIF